VQRTVFELIPGSVRAVGVIAGGQSSDPGSPHYADEAELWRRNSTHPVPIDEAGVLQTWESRLHIEPN
jgi:penicillin amidase